MYCTVWTECLWEETEVTPPSSTEDRVCGPGQDFRQVGTDLAEELLDVVVDEVGNVYVSGYTYGSFDGPNQGSADALLRKYSPSGDVLWSRQLGGAYFEAASRLALDSLGQLHALVALTNESALWILDGDGNLLAEQDYTGDAVDFGAEAEGLRYVTGRYPASDGTSDVELVQLAADGGVNWNFILSDDGDGLPGALVVLPDGGVVVAGSTDGQLFNTHPEGREVFVARFSAQGELVWGQQFAVGAEATVGEVALNLAGVLYVAGMTEGVAGGQSDAFVANIGAYDGFLGSVTMFDDALNDTSGIDWFEDVAVDYAGYATAVGATTSDLLAPSAGGYDGIFARVAPSGGFGEVNMFGSPEDDTALGIAAAPDGAFFIVGGAHGSFQGWENHGSLDGYVMRVPPYYN